MDEENKIYVGNLDYGLTDEEVKTFIQEKGFAVTGFNLITDRFSGRSKGFGFAEFDNSDDAQTAIEGLDGAELKGRKLRVNTAKRRRPQFDDRDRF